MGKSKNYIAVDLGAQSGRVMLGTVEPPAFSIEEIHRFENGPLEQDGTIRWDFPALMNHIKEGITKACQTASGPVVSIGVDSWGVDFGFIDSEGQLLENPYHYRDSRTDGMMEMAFERMGKRQIYDQTGIQFAQYNSVFQLLAAQSAQDQTLTNAHKLLFIADLVAYHLCGEIFSEYSIASTSQLMDMRSGQWSQAVFEGLGLPIEMMPDIVPTGTVLGPLKPDVAEELGCGPIPVVAVASHDTASAIAAVPSDGQNWAYLSSGTWSLMGIESQTPVINDLTFEFDFTNEGGVDKTLRILKNIVGLWLVEECRRSWKQAGIEFSYQQINDMVLSASPWAGFIDVSCADFFTPGDMPEKINNYLKKTGQSVITDKGQMIRLILESLAFRYRWVLDKLETIRGKAVDVIHCVGGGIQNEILCQFTANATNRKVLAGPVEATASGNILIQAIAAGQIRDLKEAREIVQNSVQPKEYLPCNKQEWKTHYREIKW
jgi:rhamnulokinase